MFFNQNSGFGIKGFLTKFHTVYKGYQMRLGLKTFYKMYSISHGFCLQISVF